MSGGVAVIICQVFFSSLHILTEGMLGSKSYLAKVDRSAQNLRVDIFADPVGNFRAPIGHFGF